MQYLLNTSWGHSHINRSKVISWPNGMYTFQSFTIVVSISHHKGHHHFLDKGSSFYIGKWIAQRNQLRPLSKVEALVLVSYFWALLHFSAIKQEGLWFRLLPLILHYHRSILRMLHLYWKYNQMFLLRFFSWHSASVCSVFQSIFSNCSCSGDIFYQRFHIEAVWKWRSCYSFISFIYLNYRKMLSHILKRGLTLKKKKGSWGGVIEFLRGDRIIDKQKILNLSD